MIERPDRFVVQCCTGPDEVRTVDGGTGERARNWSGGLAGNRGPAALSASASGTRDEPFRAPVDADGEQPELAGE